MANFGIEFSLGAKKEFDGLRAFDRRSVLDAIEKKLTHRPQVETQDIKCLGNEPANFGYRPPLWQLKAGAFRVFYEVDADKSFVDIRAVRSKPSNKTTSEVLNEATGS